MTGRTHLFVLLCLFLCVPRLGMASVVSRLGNIYLYDPQTFDSGILQRGFYARAGAGTDQGDLEAAIDLPFHKDFSLRVGYRQRIFLDADDAHDYIWRLRMPVIELGRFGSLISNQVIIEGSRPFGENRDPTLPRFAIGPGRAMTKMGTHRAHSLHGQALFCVRDAQQVAILTPDREGVAGRLGACVKGAHVIQLYEPTWAGSGKWTVTLSSLEMQWRHFGARVGSGGTGKLDLSPLAVGVHFTPRLATYMLGISPRITFDYAPSGLTRAFGGMLNLQISYRDFLE